MANASIAFNGNKILKELDLATQVRLPFIAQVTLNLLGPMARKDVQKDMLADLTYVSKFTIESPLYTEAKKNKLFVDVYLRTDAPGGNAPSDYLKPQIVGGDVLRTRFQKRFGTGSGGSYMLPLHDSRGAKLDEIGRIRASQYTEALYGIGAMEAFRANKNSKNYKSIGTYVRIGRSLEPRQKNRKKNPDIKGYGIYRVMGKRLVEVFRELDTLPRITRPNFTFRQYVAESVKKNFQGAFESAVAIEKRTRKT